MNRPRLRPRPVGQRAVVIAALLNVLLPGLGHVYAMYLPRALIWFSGTILVTLVLRTGPSDMALAFGMAGMLGVAAAGDVVLAMWLDSRRSGRL
jgi:hypothetical protein